MQTMKLFISNLVILYTAVVIYRYGRIITKQGRLDRDTVLMTGIMFSFLSHNQVRLYFTPHFFLDYIGMAELTPSVTAFYERFYLDIIVLEGSFALIIIAAIMHMYTSMDAVKMRGLAIEVLVLGFFAAVPLWLLPILLSVDFFGIK